MMHPFHHASTLSTFIIILFTISTNEATFPNCKQTFSCGDLRNISYPFTGGDQPPYCGHPDFQLTCNGNATPQLTINSFRYQVIQLDQTKKTLTLSRSDLYKTPCLPQIPADTNLDSSIFTLGPYDKYLTLFYGCNSDVSDESYLCDTDTVYFHVEGDDDVDDRGCNASVKVHVLESSADKLIRDPSLLGETLREGFSVEYNIPFDDLCNECVGSDRYCGFREQKGNGDFVCICGDKICKESKSSKEPVVIGAAVGGAAAICIVLGFCLFFLIKRRKQAVAQSKSKNISTPTSSQGRTVSSTTNFSRSTPYTSMSSDPEKGSDYFGVLLFRYSELEEATNGFDPSRELGDGGFGTVYYGELGDGRVVAVKRLYENNCKRVVQFMNEVEILTRLKHPNLVKLYGCTSRRSRELILVYEYIPNGTVADHLHGKQAESSLLTWNLRLGIAIETAAALAYLHASDIIHRDVKTNNILLDNNFTVKVADFGLSRLFPNDVTHVSTAPQGTPGYVDPEYYQCYQLNDKSDVYSFGVVLVELISSKQAVDISRHRHDINLATMAVNKIQCHALHELVDLSLGFDSDFSVRRTMILVAELAFRCLQQERDMRPSMEEVLKILEGLRNEQNAGKAEVVDINGEDDVAILKSDACQFSSDSSDTDKWISSSITSEKWVSSSTTT